MEYAPKYLVMVTADNHNKYYKMTPHGDSWTAEWGRIGAGSQRKDYPRSQFEQKYREKVRKGYVDQTSLVQDLIQVQVKQNVNNGYRDIENHAIATIVNRLQMMAKQAIDANYTIQSNAVTTAMVNAAQDIINRLLRITDLRMFNETLLTLFNTIPRRMGRVADYLANSTTDFSKIIKREQDLLDVMKGQVIQHVAVDTPVQNVNVGGQTILEKLGLEFEECTPADIAEIRRSLGDCRARLVNAWKVTNKKTQARFDKFCKDAGIRKKMLLFHGSRNENWWSIIQTGLVLRPTNAVITGKMFGYGLYYATKAQKSLGYTSLQGSYWAGGHSSSGFMALMDVVVGQSFDVYSHKHEYTTYNWDKLQRAKPGAKSLFAHAGKMLYNDEIIVYKEEQSTIKYLLELSK